MRGHQCRADDGAMVVLIWLGFGDSYLTLGGYLRLAPTVPAS